MILHPKIQALRNKVGHIPIHHFYPKKSAFDKLPVEQRNAKASDDSRLIKQYFCIFGIADDWGTVPMKGCFTKSIRERGPNSSASYKITVLNQHDQKKPLCLPSILKEDEIGLYAEYTPDEGIEENDDLVIRVKRGTINNGSYGFNYIWDKMEYDEENDLIIMKEVDLYEVSPVTIGSQTDTFVVRSVDGSFVDEYLEEDTERLIKKIDRQYHLELRSLIERHISLAKLQPNQYIQNSLDNNKPKHDLFDYDYLLNNLKI